MKKIKKDLIFLCTRTYFIGNKIDYKARWIKGKFYNGREPNEIEKIGGIFFYINSDNDFEYFIKEVDYNKYFKSIEDLREEKINKIFNE
jgi:hypothetical protein